MKAAPRCETIEDWFTRKPGNKEWFDALIQTGYLDLSNEYLRIEKIQFRRRILEKVETGTGKRDLNIKDYQSDRNFFWEEGDNSQVSEIDRKIKNELENCVFQYDQIMKLPHNNGFELMRGSDLKLLVDKFPVQKLSYINKEIYQNFFDFFTVVFGIHSFPSFTAGSLFHRQDFTYYWYRSQNPEIRKEYSMDAKELEGVLAHDNQQEITFGLVKKDGFGLGILTRDI